MEDNIKDYYQILKIPMNANEKEIRHAYRKAALKVHPDKNNNPEAAQLFRELTEALEVLTDPKQRQTYDKKLIDKKKKQKQWRQPQREQAEREQPQQEQPPPVETIITELFGTIIEQANQGRAAWPEIILLTGISGLAWLCSRHNS